MIEQRRVDFKKIKSIVSFKQILEHYGLFKGLKLCGEKQFKGPCPFCRTKRNISFGVNLECNCYHCFGCGLSGDILDFVARKERINLAHAAVRVAEWFEIDAEWKGPKS